MRDTSSDESRSDGKEEDDDDEGFEERQAKQGTDNPGLSVFHGDYLRAVRGTGSLSTEKRERRRIRELEKAA